MISNGVNIAETSSIGILGKIKAYAQLLKFRLSFIVAFSAGMAYLLGMRDVNWSHFSLFIIGGFLVTGSANIINQIIEVEYDRLMKRTMGRPLPTNRLSSFEAAVFSLIIGLLGVSIHLYFINVLTAVLSFTSLVLYGFVYTPLKRVGPIAVFVGAIPGALPVLIGWVAAKGLIQHEALILFGIQFIWQFPHFWAIAWVADEDYKRAGFKLLPSNGGRDLNTAFNIMIYTLMLIPLSLLPLFVGLTGITSAIIVTMAGIAFLAQTFTLMKKCDKKSALRMMFGSFIYLPIVQIAYVLDKI